jgi:hypothetical protein
VPREDPAEKRRGDLVFPIENPRGHLVCYAVTPTPAGERSILMRNQRRAAPDVHVGHPLRAVGSFAAMI